MLSINILQTCRFAEGVRFAGHDFERNVNSVISLALLNWAQNLLMAVDRRNGKVSALVRTDVNNTYYLESQVAKAKSQTSGSRRDQAVRELVGWI